MRGLLRLLQTGETAASDLREFPASRARGLWALSTDGNRAVATPALMQLWSALPNEAEAVATLAAVEPAVRVGWLRVIAARVHEAGLRGDVASLCNLIGPLGPAAEEVRAVLPEGSLKPTAHAELERSLLGASAENAVVTPPLLRLLAATASLPTSEIIAPVDLRPLDPTGAWVRNRLLRLPDADEAPCYDATAVLDGTWAPLSKAEREADDAPHEAVLRWVVMRPWPMLLAQLVFAQETWAAERLTGGLALEVADIAQFHQPPRVDVVVTLPDAREVVCGPLSELLQRALAILGVGLIAPTRDAATLDARLAPVIRELLRCKVWTFDERGRVARRPGYWIAEEFGSACLRIFGSNHFYRAGERLARALRTAAEQWAQERLIKKAPASRSALDKPATLVTA
ncbi:hypothetical protein CfE428DRAFT_1281 [Chthoniobacter flavus Ellin428]|uniref:Uncharacterized protein n=1 Tax=Chthoniobacter flavus Ellin428 TaxID=497964 RepID=B4CXJ0_9BACT|nr:hypothetical protein [Chthoniobacter flavus]EDY20988.1 hypothetical protein CfE428DRAFT_1281 [Chthoniobacter flavus Ellin428]TCO88715.1 hypothetical protein EV701_11687 [Chthoniobacter flavus]